MSPLVLNRHKARRSAVLRRPLFALALLPFSGTAVAQAVALPSGGAVQAGQATIGAPAGNALTVTQTSGRAIVNWNGFSIGTGGTVRFENGAGATLNRVSGGAVSAIDGTLSASGSVYLVNPNGVIVGAGGVVDVGGSFVASTLDIANDAFLTGDMTFAGASTARVVNMGRIGALGGDVALIALGSGSGGTINAPSGTVGLLAGSRVLLRDAALDGGRFVVEIGDPSAAVTHSGTIQAAAAELRANGGNVYALAGNVGSGIRATGLAARDGRIYLTAGGGNVAAAGDIVARGPNGSAGAVETTGANLDVAGARVDAGSGGSWRLTEINALIDQPQAAAIAASLGTGTNVTVATIGAANGGQSDVVLAPATTLGWATGAGLTLSGYASVSLGQGARLASTGGGAVTLRADNQGSGTGTVFVASDARILTAGAIDILYNPASYTDAGTRSQQVGVTSAPLTYQNPYLGAVQGGGTLTAYMLVNTTGNLQDMRLNPGGIYALGRDIDARETGAWNFGAGFAPILDFRGLFDGRGRVITGLTINRPGETNVGLFGRDYYSSDLNERGTIVLRDVTLADVAILGGSSVGALIGSIQTAGNARSRVDQVHVTGSIAGGSNVGGIVGLTFAPLADVSADVAVAGSRPDATRPSGIGGIAGRAQAGFTNATVAGTVRGGDSVGGVIGIFNAGGDTLLNLTSSAQVSGNDDIGGLVGFGYAPLTDSSATGAVTGSSNVGGLFGNGRAAFTRTYATGTVTGDHNVGGLVGYTSTSCCIAGGVITDSYATGLVDGITNVGGLIGNAQLTTISKSYATGNVNGNASVGGILGYSDGSTLTTVYASGSVSGTSAGGLIGLAHGFDALGRTYLTQITNSYWDSYATTQAAAIGGTVELAPVLTNVTAIGTASDAYTQATYAAFDFTNDWFMVDSATRPFLRSEYSTTIANVHQLQLIAMDPNASYAITRDFDAGETGRANGMFRGVGFGTGFAPIGRVPSYTNASDGSGFTGTLDGRGHAIANLTGKIFTYVLASGAVRNLDLVNVRAIGRIEECCYLRGEGAIAGWSDGLVENVHVSGTVGGTFGAGAVVGYNRGTVRNSTSNATVLLNPIVIRARGTRYASGTWAGGLVGYNSGTITGSSSEGSVVPGTTSDPLTAYPGSQVGGLVGYNNGTIDNSWSGASVSGFTMIGGLVGYNDGTNRGGLGGIVTNSYAVGSVAGTSLAGGLIGKSDYGQVRGVYASGLVTGTEFTGGLIGSTLQGTLRDAFWDVGTTGRSSALGAGTDNAVQTNVVGIGGAAAPFQRTSYQGLDFGATWFQIDDRTRPLLRSEYATTIRTGHQLQLISLGLGQNYALGGDIALTELASPSGVWKPATGFVPIASFAAPYAGILDGAGRTVSGLRITRPELNSVGLFAFLNGSVRDLALTDVAIAGAGATAALAGTVRDGAAIDRVIVAGNVTGTSYSTGGIVGADISAQFGATRIADSEFSGAVRGAFQVGGLAGSFYGTVSRSQNRGAISGTDIDTGGLVGLSAGTIEASANSGSVTGTGLVGGLAGATANYAAGNPLSGIRTSVNLGTVTGAGANVGGLVGFNQLAVADSYSVGAVTGGTNVGGLIGQNAQTGALTRSHASGRVVQTGACGFACAAGLVGVNAGGAVTNAYWDVATTGQSQGATVGSGAAPGTIANLVAIGGQTGADPYRQASYAALGFAGPWTILDGEIRPFLRSENGARIGNAHQLQAIGLGLSRDYTLAADVDLAELADPAGLWRTGGGFVPIGTIASGFTGLLDGDGHRISRLAISRGADNVGLFAFLDFGSTVRDLTLSGGGVAGNSRVGALAGTAAGLVTGVTGDVAVTGVKQSIGGLIGANYGIVRVAVAGGSVTVTGPNVDSFFAGGLAGYNGGRMTLAAAYGPVVGNGSVGGLVGFNDVNARIDNAGAFGAVRGIDYVGGFAGYSSGTLDSVHGDAAVIGSGNQVGGLVGFSGGAIFASYALGDVSGGAFVGGLVGTAGGRVFNSSAQGKVTGITYVGGLAGKSDGTIADGAARGAVSATLEHSGGLVGASYGTISRSYASGEVNGANFTGGLAGFNGGRITLSEAVGRVAGIDLVGGLVGLNDGAARTDNSSASGNVAGRGYVGGLAGYNSGVIDSVSARGTVTGEAQIGGLVGLNGNLVTVAVASGAVSGRDFIGGLAGSNSGTVRFGSASGSATGSAYIGGLVGKNDGNLSDSFASGATTGTLDGVGGLIGSSSGTVARVYASGAASGRNYVGGLTGYNGGSLIDGYAIGTVAGAYLVGGIAGMNGGDGAIAQVYAAGAVRGIGLTGGLAGVNAARVANAFWDLAATGQPAAFGQAGGTVTGATSIGGGSGRDPWLQGTYVGFDFSNVWTIQPGLSRPYLRAIPPASPPN